MRYLSILILLCAPVLPGVRATLEAQPLPGEDDGSLYFPPKLIFASQRERPRLMQSESRYFTSIPVLPIVFFDYPGDWNIPSRYQVFNGSSAARDYTDSNAVSGLEFGGYQGKYREILNIIGFRMQQYPGTRIQLQGGFSTEPGESSKVAQTRAEIVREYLMNIWDIQPERIGLLDPIAGCDSTANSLRQEEARRVMIQTGSWELLQPVSYPIEYKTLGSVYLQFAVDPQVPPDQVANVVIVIKADNNVIGEAVIPGHPDSTLYRLRGGWTPNQARINSASSFTRLSFYAVVQSVDGLTRSSNEETIPVEFNRYESRESERQVRPIFIPFFACGDSTITGYHQVLVSHLLATQETSEPLVAELIGTGEYSEDPTIDEGMILEYKARKNEAGFNQNFQNDINSYGTLTIFTPRPVDADFDLTQPPITDITPESARDIEESSSDSSSLKNQQAFTLDSLAVARARNMENYLRETFQDKLIIMDQAMRRQRNTSINQLHLLPELRWYSRSVNIVLYPYKAVAQYLEQAEESEENSSALPRNR